MNPAPRRRWGRAWMLLVAPLLAGCEALPPVSTFFSPASESLPAISAEAAMPAAQEAFAEGNFGYAARYFEQALLIQPESPQACLGLAGSYDWLRRFDLADAIYARCERLVGSSFIYHNNLGFSFLLRGDFARAEISLNRALALQPDSPVVATNLRILRSARNG